MSSKEKKTMQRTIWMENGAERARTDLSDWTIRWNRCVREAIFQLVSASTLAFPKRMQSSPEQTKAYPPVFRFKDLANALDHGTCTANILAVKPAMLDLMQAASVESYPVVLKGELPSVQTSTTAATGCADTLCMGLPYLFEPKHGKFGLVAIAAPQGMAMECYRLLRDYTGSKQASQKLAWREYAAAAIERYGIRMIQSGRDG